MVIDFSDLKKIINDEIVDVFDHLKIRCGPEAPEAK